MQYGGAAPFGYGYLPPTGRYEQPPSRKSSATLAKTPGLPGVENFSTPAGVDLYMPSALSIPRRVALASIAVLVTATSATALAESYRALVTWSARHGITGALASVWPLQVDTFVVIGELALFVALADGWSVRSRVGAWGVALTGLAVSVAANVGHTVSGDWLTRATFAVPPLAAAASLAVGLGVLKRVVGAQRAGVADASVTADPLGMALSEATSDAAKIRLAVNTTGSGDASVLAGWLQERGHQVSLANIKTVLRRQAASPDGQPGVIPIRGAAG
jgi:hypothetical protein